jgi:hypothetical protein
MWEASEKLKKLKQCLIQAKVYPFWQKIELKISRTVPLKALTPYCFK